MSFTNQNFIYYLPITNVSVDNIVCLWINHAHNTENGDYSHSLLPFIVVCFKVRNHPDLLLFSYVHIPGIICIKIYGFLLPWSLVYYTKSYYYAGDRNFYNQLFRMCFNDSKCTCINRNEIWRNLNKFWGCYIIQIRYALYNIFDTISNNHFLLLSLMIIICSFDHLWNQN